ncbi:MAG: putative sugar nucleotidyl transferase [Planctomycetota bacterium]
MKLICFEDPAVRQLEPITYARPAYAITCASFQLLDWLRELSAELTVSVRSYLAPLENADRDLTAPDWSDLNGEDVLLVNARLVPRVELRSRLRQLWEQPTSGVVRCPQTDSILVARFKASDLVQRGPEGQGNTSQVSEAVSPFQTTKRNATGELRQPSDEGVVKRLIEIASNFPNGTLAASAEELPAFRWPHEVVAWHMKEMNEAMNYRIASGRYRETEDGIFVAEGVSIGDHAVVDTSDGPIVFEEDVSVGPFCYLAGPVFAGKKTRVIEHAALKDAVALGHTVKIGGEVEASVIEPYSNKQHHGFLGHSYLGSWINLGAGTCNSDLKNTYGKINVEYGGEKISTGMQFFGCVMGDYSKTAINTSIFTGKVIGVCSMLYGFATSNVPSFVNYARLFGQQSLLPAEVMVNTQQRMFSRRKVEQREADIQLIHDMYQLSAAEREQGDLY